MYLEINMNVKTNFSHHKTDIRTAYKELTTSIKAMSGLAGYASDVFEYDRAKLILRRVFSLVTIELDFPKSASRIICQVRRLVSLVSWQ